MWVLDGRLFLVFLFLQSISSARGQQVNVPIPGLGGGHRGRWYVWLIVSIAGVFLIWTAFFTVRGFLVARKRKKALQAGGLSQEDDVYTAQHVGILRKLVPQYKMPQGKGSTNFSPMMSTVVKDWGQKPNGSAAEKV